MDIKEYLAAGERLEGCSPAPWEVVCEGSQWHIDGHETRNGLYVGVTKRICSLEGWDADTWADENARFIADARERLPKYRKALEAVLAAVEAEEDYDFGCRQYVVESRHIFEAIRKALE